MSSALCALCAMQLEEEAASVSQQEWGTRKQLVVFFGNAGIGTRVPHQQGQLNLEQPQPCEEELDSSKPTRPEDWNPKPGQVQNRLLRSAWSKRFEAPVRGLMWCPWLAQATPGDLGKWVDRDCNAALNLQRAGESKWRPLELCRWPHRGRLPAQGKEYPALGFKKLRERAPKAQAQQPVAQWCCMALPLLSHWSARLGSAAEQAVLGSDPLEVPFGALRLLDITCPYFCASFGRSYEGLCRQGALHRNGVLYYPSGDRVYRGEWYRGLMHGCGVKLWPTSSPTAAPTQPASPALAALGPSPVGPQPTSTAAGTLAAQEGKFFNDRFIGPVMDCSVEAAQEAAVEADVAAATARAFTTSHGKARRGRAAYPTQQAARRQPSQQQGVVGKEQLLGAGSRAGGAAQAGGSPHLPPLSDAVLPHALGRVLQPLRGLWQSLQARARDIEGHTQPVPGSVASSGVGRGLHELLAGRRDSGMGSSTVAAGHAGGARGEGWGGERGQGATPGVGKGDKGEGQGWSQGPGVVITPDGTAVPVPANHPSQAPGVKWHARALTEREQHMVERRQVIKAGLRGLVKAALPDLSPAQVDAIVAEINKRMTMGSKQCCLTAVLCLSFLGQPSPAQPTRDFPAAGPAPGPPPPPDPACPPYAHPRLATHSSPRTAAAPAQLPFPVQLDIWDPQLLVQLKKAMELLTNATVLEHMMRGPHHRGIRLLPGEVAVFEQPSSAWPVAML
ncbi:hypothetical protein QJQ45_006666 [Haematococcus lacustris]|nr:hypothetical protein QJQ45_006666 [Haematococcus lacustris]